MRHTTGLLALIVGITLLGCNDQDTSKGGGGSTPATSVAKNGNKHAGWWCNEHGIPEDDCLMCKKNGEEECKKKGDWCEIHEFCKSQCFGCNPKLKEQYAAQYKAKHGKDAPEPDDNPPGKNPGKN